LRLVDLKYNSFSNENILEFLPYLKNNKTILALDLRYNEGFVEDNHKRIALVLLKNIENAFKRKCTIKNYWIIKPLIFIDIPQSKSNYFIPRAINYSCLSIVSYSSRIEVSDLRGRHLGLYNLEKA
jgi:uncharacterized protein YeeX (DUF496 family)